LWRMLSIPYIFFWHIPLSTRSRWVLPAFLFFCFRSPKPANAFPSPVWHSCFFFTTGRRRQSGLALCSVCFPLCCCCQDDTAHRRCPSQSKTRCRKTFSHVAIFVFRV
jgi:hypothetical protein